MKQPKKLTRSQKEAVSAAYLNASEWMLCLPVAAAIGGLALDDDALAAERTWMRLPGNL